jgi:hypothetical protein
MPAGYRPAAYRPQSVRCLTVAKLCGATAPAKSTDGLDVWQLWTGEANRIDREPLLDSDDVHL